MSKELILMIVYDNGEPKAKTEMFISGNFKQLYTIKNNFKKRKDIKFIMYKIYQKIEESEKQKAIETYNKKEDFYNQERHVHENNHKILGEIWNSCQDLYIIEK